MHICTQQKGPPLLNRYRDFPLHLHTLEQERIETEQDKKGLGSQGNVGIVQKIGHWYIDVCLCKELLTLSSSKISL
jgi:hypothetical protein